MAIVQPKLGDDVPESIKELIQEIGFFIPDQLQGDEPLVYNRAVQGQCMTCSAECADTTMVVLNRAGVIMIYCGGTCYSDMQVMGWLEEQHSDMVQAVKFRGGAIEADGGDLPKNGPGTVEGSE